MSGKVFAAELASVIREKLEEYFPPHRRAAGWDRKWQDVEDFANATDAD